MKEFKIVFVYDVIYPYVKGGGERRFYEFGTRLATSGYDVHWYGMKYWVGPRTIEHDGIILHGLCKARPIYTKSGRRSISQALIFGLSCFKLLFVDFDVIDCCGFPYFSLFPTKLAALIKRRPLFATWYEVWGKEYWREYLGVAGIFGYWVERIAAKLPNHIIAISQHTADLLKVNLGVKNVDIVTNGVDINKIANLKAAENSSDIIYAGRLMDFKNIHLIIESLADLKNKGKILSCIIIGKGPEKTKLQKLSTRLGVNNQIRWLGFFEKSDDVYAYMKASKVFVLPSRREGFGMVVIEANACGLPVLSANYQGNASRDLIKNGVNGYVFKPTIEDLSAAIEKVLLQGKKLEQQCVYSAKIFDLDILVNKLSEAYAR